MKFFERQILHLFLLALLILALFFLSQGNSAVLSGRLWGMKTIVWFWLAVSVPIVHQFFVLISWRLELHYNFLSQELGDKAFSYYALIFFLQFLSRMVYLVFLAIANSNSFEMDSTMQYGIISFISIVVIYAFYSIIKYFGMDRAAGLDHFDSTVAKKPLVKQGIFKYTNNGMYSYAFLIFYLPAFIYMSLGALVVALFSHLYIWVHYYCTELPDMKHIYKS